jgi:hypothetical protein
VNRELKMQLYGIPSNHGSISIAGSMLKRGGKRLCTKGDGTRTARRTKNVKWVCEDDDDGKENKDCT